MFAYEIVRQNHLSKEQALATCFVAGCMFLLLAMTGLSTAIASQVPLSLKKAVVVGLGMLQTIIGLTAMGMIQQGDHTILEAATVHHHSQYMSIFTILLIALLILFEIPGSILIGIVVSMAVSLVLKFTPLPESLFSMPTLNVGVYDFSVFQTQKGYFITLLIFFVLFVDTGGVVIGVAAQGGALLDKNGDCVNSTKAYVVLALGVILSSLLGTSPMVIFLESAAAVNQGGRTGLTAVVAGIMLGASAFFVPVLSSVPNSATSPVMILVGSFMMGAVLAVPWNKINHSLPAFVTITVTAFTCSISNGLIVGVTFYVVLYLPFFVLHMTRWQCLAERLVMDESVPTGLEKRTNWEREVDRRTASLFDPSSYTDDVYSPSPPTPTASSVKSPQSPNRRAPPGNVGWL